MGDPIERASRRKDRHPKLGEAQLGAFPIRKPGAVGARGLQMAGGALDRIGHEAYGLSR